MLSAFERSFFRPVTQIYVKIYFSMDHIHSYNETKTESCCTNDPDDNSDDNYVVHICF